MPICRYSVWVHASNVLNSVRSDPVTVTVRRAIGHVTLDYDDQPVINANITFKV